MLADTHKTQGGPSRPTPDLLLVQVATCILAYCTVCYGHIGGIQGSVWQTVAIFVPVLYGGVVIVVVLATPNWVYRVFVKANRGEGNFCPSFSMTCS